MRTCEVIEHGVRCEGQTQARGMCSTHYSRWRRHGDPLKVHLVRAKRDLEKWCPGCDSWKPKDHFNKAKPQKDGLEGKCRSCVRTGKYGVNQQQFNQMLSDQGGSCAACGASDPGGTGSWSVDHDHACCPGSGSCGDCVRGLLCHYCNTGLGLFNDDPDRLLAAAMYILKHTTNTEVRQ